jgi:outer membrane lipase/esterase
MRQERCALRSPKGALAAGTALWLALAAPADAQSFSNFYVFGDSLSDAGTFRSPAAPTVGLRFTTNPGLEWNQILGSMYGITVSPYKANVGDATLSVITSSSILGGNNYAQGGACVNSAFSAACPMFGLNDLGISQQVATYLGATGGKANPSALYSVWGGGNDVFSQLQFVGAGTSTPTLAVLALGTAGSIEAQSVGALVAAGAHFVIVPSLPDIGSTPFGTALGPTTAGFASLLSSTFNSSLSAGLQAVGGTSIIYADVGGLLREIIKSPGSYGFTNVTAPACTTSSSIVCNSTTLVAPNAASTYLFADAVHPTSAGQLGEAQYIQSLLSAPGRIALLAESPIFAARGIERTLDQRSGAEVRTDYGWTIYGNADIAPGEVTPAGSAGSKGTLDSGHVGVEYGGANGLRAGALFTLADGSYDLSGGGGRYDMTLTAQTLYGSYTWGGAFLQGSLTVGRLDFDKVQRVNAILADTRVNSGKTHGDYTGGRLLFGYDHRLNNLTLTPLLSVSAERDSIDGYSEGQGDSTSMVFGRQRRRLLVGAAGGRVAMITEWAGVTLEPSAEITYSDDFTDQKRYVMANVVGAPTSFAMPVSEPGRSWTTLSAALNASLGGGLSVGVGGGGAIGQRGASSSFGTVSVAYRF